MLLDQTVLLDLFWNGELFKLLNKKQNLLEDKRTAFLNVKAFLKPCVSELSVLIIAWSKNYK